MGNAQTGAMTDLTHNVHMCSMNDAQTGAMTDNVWTEGTYDVWTDGAQTGAMADIL